MKKYIILALAVLTLGVSTVRASWLDNGEKERRIELQQQLNQQQHETSHWQGVAFVLGISAVFTLITGTIIGSRARKHANQSQ
jgi:hypothetical protein